MSWTHKTFQRTDLWEKAWFLWTVFSILVLRMYGLIYDVRGRRQDRYVWYSSFEPSRFNKHLPQTFLRQMPILQHSPILLPCLYHKLKARFQLYRNQASNNHLHRCPEMIPMDSTMYSLHQIQLLLRIMKVLWVFRNQRVLQNT